jgi:recombinational DNA repair protein RecT
METKVVQQNNKTNLMQVIQSTPATQLAAIPEIADRFKKLYSIIHPGSKSDIFYEAEKFHFMKLLQENKKLQECSKLSLYGTFMDVAVNGLSFDPSFKHLYLVPYNTNVGTQQSPTWEKRVQLQISGYGELVLRQKQGQIKYADNPVLVYEDDEFAFGNRNGRGFIDHVSKLPRTSHKIIACYLRIVRPDGSVDYKIITQDDMDRFRKFSKDADKSKAWSDGIGGMWMAKCIKHAFKNYPKVRTGEFSQLASQTVDEDAQVVDDAAGMNVPETIDYGVAGSESQNNNGNSFSDVDDDSFTGSETPAGNNVTHNDDDF